LFAHIIGSEYNQRQNSWELVTLPTIGTAESLVKGAKMLDYAALFVIFFLMVGIAAAIVFLGSLPGKIARQRNHPYPVAVNAASWIGLATGVFWPVAFIWAFLPVPSRSTASSAEAARPNVDTGDLGGRIASLEAAVEQLKTQVEEGTS